jgi:hypothetical protein
MCKWKARRARRRGDPERGARERLAPSCASAQLGARCRAGAARGEGAPGPSASRASLTAGGRLRHPTPCPSTTSASSTTLLRLGSARLEAFRRGSTSSPHRTLRQPCTSYPPGPRCSASRSRWRCCPVAHSSRAARPLAPAVPDGLPAAAAAPRALSFCRPCLLSRHTRVA